MPPQETLAVRYHWVFHGVMIAAIIAAIVMNVLIRSGRRASHPLADYGALPNFSLTERSGKPLTQADLLGKIWIADFIFTHCAGPCPLMSARMAKLQASLKELADVRLVSFTVDPVRDTPSVLAKYADNYGADPKKWFFLTGEASAIYSLSTNGFHLAAIEDSDGKNQPDHSTRFALVDRKAHLRGYYDGTSEEAIARLITDVKQLLRERS